MPTSILQVILTDVQKVLQVQQEGQQKILDQLAAMQATDQALDQQILDLCKLIESQLQPPSEVVGIGASHGPVTPNQ